MFPSLTRDEVYRIETPRLWLRWPRAEDAVGLAGWVGRPEVATMTSTFKVGIVAAEIAVRLLQNRDTNAAGRSLSFVMTRQGNDAQPIGMVGVHVRPERRLELGYYLDPAWWGRGLMTEAVRALAEQVFDLTAAARIEAGVRPDNVGSVRVLEKSGFVPTGHGYHESPIYGRYPVDTYALARSRPSPLLTAQRRFSAPPPVHYELVGLV